MDSRPQLLVNEPSDDIQDLIEADNWEQIFQHLQTSLEDITYRTDRNQRTLLHYACLRQNRQDIEPTVAGILAHLDIQNISESRKVNFINQEDVNYDTALQLASTGFHQGVVKLLVRRGANISKLKPDSDIDAIQKLYNPVITSSFDEALQVAEDWHERENKLLWSVNCKLGPIYGLHNAPFESAFVQSRHLAIMLRRKIVKQSVILKHPLVEIFLHFKRSKFAGWLYVVMALQILWSLLSFTFIFCNTHIRNSASANRTSSESNYTKYCQPFRIYGEDTKQLVFSAYLGFMIVFWLLVIVVELTKFLLYTEKKYYCSQHENQGQWIVIGSMVTVMIVALTRKPVKYEETIFNIKSLQGFEHFLSADFLPAVYIMGMFASLLLIQSQLAKTTYLGVYNEMFKSAFRGIIKFILSFLPILFAFLATLHILLPMKPELDPEWGLGFTKVLVMMTGDVGYDDIFHGEDENDIVFRNVLKIFFLVFVVTVVILLQNLLIGLTVSDVQKLEQTATVKHFASVVEDICLLENVLLSPPVWKSIRYFGWEDWCIRKFMVGKDDFSTTDAAGRAWKKQLKDYPKELRDAIIEWKNGRED